MRKTFIDESKRWWSWSSKSPRYVWNRIFGTGVFDNGRGLKEVNTPPSASMPIESDDSRGKVNYTTL